MGRLNNKVAMISGGALGIGEADSLLFAREGAKVVVADVNTAAGEALVQRIRAEGGEAMFLRLDVSRESDWADGMDAVIEAYGKLNILVNNAGANWKGIYL